MKTIFKHKFLAGAVALATIFATSSCEDTDTGLKVTGEVPYADKTLYEVLNAQEDLTSFMEVVNACGAECADSLFNKSRVYTVWAPVNEAMADIKDGLIERINNGERDEVFKTFVMAHVANHLRPANGVLDENNRIMMLNDKKTPFVGSYAEGYKFDDCRIAVANIRAWNGVLHKLEKAAEYKYNIWEFLANDASMFGGYSIDSLSNYLYSFNKYEFNEHQSILGPVVDGEQTYLDSVFTTENEWLNPWNGIGNVDVEDSIYTIYVPTNEVWDEMIALARSHFNYNSEAFKPTSMKVSDIDSLREYYPHFHVLKYLTFSEGERKYVENQHPDSMMPVNSHKHPRPVFPKEMFENEHIVFEKEMSNGYFKIVDKFPYAATDLWLDTIRLEGENNTMRYECSTNNNSNYSATELQINKEDSLLVNSRISGNYYFAAESEKEEINVQFRIPNVLSAKYKVALIVVPKHITNPRITADQLKPTYYNVEIRQDGTDKALYSYTDKKFYNDPKRVDTLFLLDSKGEPAIIDVPYCEYYYGARTHEDYSTKMTISSINPGRTVKEKDYSIRLDAVLLIPVVEEE